MHIKRKIGMPEQSISRVLFPALNSEKVSGMLGPPSNSGKNPAVRRYLLEVECRAMAIHLGPPLPMGSSDLPGSSGGPPSSAPLFGLAPGGVCLAPAVTDGTGELLPHRFTLTRHSTLSRAHI